MKDRIRERIDIFLFDHVVPSRVQSMLPRTAIFYMFFGVIATSIDIGVFYAAYTWLGVGYLFANVVAFVFSSATNFVTNKYLNYQNKSQRVALQYTVHLAVALSSLFWGSLLLYLFIDILGLLPLLAKLISALIVAFYSYAVHTKVTFGHSHFSE